MTAYARHVSPRQTPQSEPLFDKAMVPNSAGGYAFPVDDWTRLDRFLVLGNPGGTYYASEQKLTVENAACVLACGSADPRRTVGRIVEISRSGRAPKNDPAVFALALLACHKSAAQADALAALPQVCRTGTHLFQFVAACQEMRGWGRGLRRAVADWYLSKAPADLAYQVLKYQQRDGWSHRDVLRLAHPRASGSTNDVLYWSVKGWPGVGEDPHPDEALRRIWAFERLKRSPTVELAVRLIREYALTREMVPTPLLKDAAVWDALLERMPFTAMLRNLATMTRVGLIASSSAGTAHVVAALGDGDRLRAARVHPLTVLTALKTYAQGHGDRGGHSWTPVPQVVDALDAAFYTSFGNVRPTGKRWLLGIDVSASMSTPCGGSPLSCCEGATAMALVTARTESAYSICAFNSGLAKLPITAQTRLADALRYTQNINGGGTDCALPMVAALRERRPVDVFAVYTDNETWAGAVHPVQALTEYRQRMGIGAKLVVIGMTSTGFTIADPADAGMMDVAGWDAAVPTVIADFAGAAAAGAGEE